MTKPASLVLTVYQGQTFNDQLALQDSTGALIDLTGYNAAMMARSDVDAPDPPLLSWTSAAGNIVLGGAAGTITFAIPAAVTAALTTAAGMSAPNDINMWVYDMVLTSSAGVAERIVQGSLIIYPAVTR